MKARLLSVFAAVVLAFAAFAAAAQAYNGFGYVTRNGAVKPNKQVVAYNYRTGAYGFTTTNGSGWYNFGGLVAGTQYEFYVCDGISGGINFGYTVFTQPSNDQQHNISINSFSQSC
jgi:hypothetical protein